MKSLFRTTLLFLLPLFTLPLQAQIDEDQLGAWYSWFYNRNIQDTPWATQMIIQQRYYDITSDLQQRLVLGLVSYKPKDHPIRYGAGYYHLRHGTFGPSTVTRDEHIIFQQGIVSKKLGEKNFMTYRLRLEEHLPENRDNFRRLRAFVTINRPLNQSTLDQGAVYLSLYDEYFVDLDNVNYALNHAYAGLGWKMTDHTSWQVGIMRQTTKTYAKNQLMFNLYHHY